MKGVLNLAAVIFFAAISFIAAFIFVMQFIDPERDQIFNTKSWNVFWMEQIALALITLASSISARRFYRKLEFKI